MSLMDTEKANQLARAAKTIDPAKIGKILIRAVNWLGDAVMTTPAIGTVREYFPNARITVLATPLVAELFSPHPCVDEVLVYDRKGRHRGLLGRLRLAAELRTHRFELAILFPNSFDAAFVAWLARVPLRLGYGTDGRRMLLNLEVPPDVRPLAEHQTRYYLACLNHWGIVAGVKPQYLQVTPEEALRCAATLLDKGIGPDDFVLGINPGATYGSAKRWYPERFAQVADELAERWHAKVIITGGRDEVAISRDISGLMKHSCLDVTGKTTVRELMSLISRCNFFVTNDSGPMHIAAAFDVPQIAVFGSTDHRTTYPFSEYAAIVRGNVDCAPCMKRECPTDHRCMSAVTAEEVIDRAVELRSAVSGGRH
jgi:heptosyltransferase-2